MDAETSNQRAKHDSADAGLPKMLVDWGIIYVTKILSTVCIGKGDICYLLQFTPQMMKNTLVVTFPRKFSELTIFDDVLPKNKTYNILFLHSCC